MFVSTFNMAGQADGFYYLHYKAVDILENIENTRIGTGAGTTVPVTGWR